MWKIVIFITVTLVCVCCQVQRAVVVLRAKGIEGSVRFTQTEIGVRVEGTIEGISPGCHGFHVHQSGDLSNGCTSAGPHFNPLQRRHGAPEDDDRHVGDLGNVVADDRGRATVDFVDGLISLNGANSIVGRAVVLHADPDDLGRGGFEDSRSTGHAGARIACGVVGLL